MTRVKNFIKKMGKSYINGYIKLYRPAIDNGINPFSI